MHFIYMKLINLSSNYSRYAKMHTSGEQNRSSSSLSEIPEQCHMWSHNSDNRKYFWQMRHFSFRVELVRFTALVGILFWIGCRYILFCPPTVALNDFAALEQFRTFKSLQLGEQFIISKPPSNWGNPLKLPPSSFSSVVIFSFTAISSSSKSSLIFLIPNPASINICFSVFEGTLVENRFARQTNCGVHGCPFRLAQLSNTDSLAVGVNPKSLRISNTCW